MKNRVSILLVVLLLLLIGSVVYTRVGSKEVVPAEPRKTGVIVLGTFDQAKMKPEAEWKKLLTPEQFHILREAGTEIAGTGILDHETRKGTYYSAGCNEPVFRSEKKYDSGTGWPSFWAPITEDSLVLREEPGGRIEVLDTCGGHLGHVFDDGPPPTGKRYCMNSGALTFVPDNK
jgi:peptide-methionine (R)-S-oxide reductase